jgi:hypothetical protein
VFFILKGIYMRVVKPPLSSVSDKTFLLPFYAMFSLVMLFTLHGASAAKVLAILFVNFSIASLGKGARWTVPATWIFNAAVLFANEKYEGYRYGSIHDGFAFLVRYRMYSTLSRPFLSNGNVRTPSKASTLVGTSPSISPCCVSSRSTWISTGHITVSAHPMSVAAF